MSFYSLIPASGSYRLWRWERFMLLGNGVFIRPITPLAKYFLSSTQAVMNQGVLRVGVVLAGTCYVTPQMLQIFKAVMV